MTGNGVTLKGIQTKQRILDAALRLFEEQGYERTTVRAIAGEARVALGNVYRYFQSKEDFVIAFYQELAERQNEKASASMHSCASFRDRLVACVRCKLAVVEQYRDFFVELFCVAARPGSVLNPFAEASEATRRTAIAAFEEVVSGSDEKIPHDLRVELPWLLWLYCMGIILFWMHDQSAARYKTHHLIESTADIITKLLLLMALPVMAPIRSNLLKLLRTIKS